MRSEEVSSEVLVVGAGPVGLSLAVELGRRGVAVTVVEAAERVGRSPRAKTINVRSMEHMRRWGLAEAIRDASPLPEGYANRVVFATGMFGHTITAFDNVNFTDRVRDDRFSEPGQWIPQYAVEEVLFEAARALPSVTIRMGRPLEALSQDETGVTARLAGGEIVRTGYLVGADGARSTVRHALGIEMEGAGAIGSFVTYILRVPGLSARHNQGDGLMYWLINPRAPGIIGPMDRDDTWFWGAQVPPDAVPDEMAMKARIAASLGGDLRFEVLSHDLWIARRLIAKSYGGGRVFLAGDACHLHPPFGGYGMNLGIGDAVDLGWKLAATLRGWGRPYLLASYETERRPLHQRVVDEAVENMAQLAEHFTNPDLAAEGPKGDAARAAAAIAIRAGKEREFNSLGLVKGYCYEGSPLSTPDGTLAPEPSVMVYTAAARPGHVAPHAWLPDGSSLYDHFGPGFTLLCFGGDSAAMKRAARTAGIPIRILRYDDPALRSLYGAALVLIRPDQHVAWRGDPPDATRAEAILATACGDF